MKLDFRLVPYESMLAADIDDGYYVIYGGDKFEARGFVKQQLIELGEFTSIYEALDAANTHHDEGV
jgi:hypothetical protein